MRGLRSILLLMLMVLGLSGVSGQAVAAAKDKERVPFVMQMTAEESQQRRAFMQIAKVLEDIGPDKIKIGSG